MPFSGGSYRPLNGAKCGNGTDSASSQVDEDLDLYDEETIQPISVDDALFGESITYSQPKNGLSILVPCCINLKKKLRSGIRKIISFAFGRWPIALFVLIGYLALTTGLTSMALTGKYHEFKKDISLNSFMVPDIPVSRGYSAFNAARGQDRAFKISPSMDLFNAANCLKNEIKPNLRSIRHKRETSSQRYQHFDRQKSLSWTLDLVYVAKGSNDTNMFTKDRLQVVHEFEKKMMRHTDYKKHCLLSSLSIHDLFLKSYGYCTPPNSLTAFFFPSKWGVFDGQGDTIQPLKDTLKFLQSRKYFYSFVDKNYDPKSMYSNILRAQFLFGSPVNGIKTGAAQKEEFKRYLRSYINELEAFTSSEVTLLYGGGDLFDDLVERALLSDLHLALISLVLIIILLLILTFSLWLTFMAVISIISSIALAYFFYHVVFGIQYMGILNGVSLFVIIGIGVDDIFVFINTFRQAVDNRDLGDRIYHTISVAGKATFFTSFTTAAAFGANALSPIPAIHDFGLFMTILVVSCWVTVMVIMSATLSLWDAGIHSLEAMLCHKILLLIGLKRNERLRLPDDIREFLSGMRGTDNNVPQYTLLSSEPHDPLEMQSLVHWNNEDNDDDDDELLVIDNSSPSNPEQQVDSLGFRLQSILYHFVAKPVINARVVILVVSLLIFGLSVFFLTKLKVSTEQPKFFKPGSNLQRWLELPDVNFQSSNLMLKDLQSMMNSVTTAPPKEITKPAKKHKSKKPTTTPAGRRPTSSQHTSKMLTTLPKSDGTTAPITRQPVSTKRQKTTLNPTTSFRTTEQLDESTSPWQHGTNPPTFAPETVEPATEFTSTNVNGMGIYNSTMSPTPTENPCRMTYCGATGVCKVNNGTATCHCQPPYIGKFCSIYCPVRTITGNCCVIPFTYQGKQQFGCLIDESKKLSWCSLTNDYDADRKKEYCNTTVANQCEVRTLTPNKSCCVFPFIHKMVQYYYCTRELSGYGNHLMCGIQHNPTTFYRCDIHRLSLCSSSKPCVPAKKEPDGTNALVYLVFGIKGIDQDSIDRRHVLKETQGTVMYDHRLPLDMSCSPKEMIKALCTICIKMANKKELVDAADCFPKKVRDTLVRMFPDSCADLPPPALIDKKHHSIVVIRNRTQLKWLAMAFQSTTGKLSSYSSQQKDYRKWEKFIQDILHETGVPSSLQTGFQTSETWVKMFSGMVVVESAVYGIVVSLVLCLAAVVIFTGHALLFVILFMTILGVLLTVTAIFYLSGWQLGGVEAVSLSILVGTSVDYCFHLVEGYILAGEAVDPALTAKKSRQWRAKAAMSHIGMSIISSAITTVFAAIPLCLTQIQLFAKFGLIVTINTGVSLLYTMTVTMAMLSTFGPARFRASFLSCAIGALVVAVCGGLVVLVMYLVSIKQGVCIPSPQGTPLFHC